MRPWRMTSSRHLFRMPPERVPGAVFKGKSFFGRRMNGWIFDRAVLFCCFFLYFEDISYADET